MLKNLAKTTIPLLGLYLAIWFVEYDYNFAYWSGLSRFMLVLGVLLGILSLFVLKTPSDTAN